jgi:hypothetical protein
VTPSVRKSFMAFENTLVKSRAGECRCLDVLRLVPCRRGLLESPCPILRSPAAVSDSPDCDYGLLLRIDDRKRKTPKLEFSTVVLAHWPPFRRLRIVSASSVEFFYKIQGCFGAALLIPRNRAFYVRDCALVILKPISDDSPWPVVRGEVLPKEQ